MPPALAGASDAEKLRAVDAQISPDLGVVVASHRADSIASVDYRVTNIRREEPPESYFEVPGARPPSRDAACQRRLRAK